MSDQIHLQITIFQAASVSNLQDVIDRVPSRIIIHIQLMGTF